MKLNKEVISSWILTTARLRYVCDPTDSKVLESQELKDVLAKHFDSWMTINNALEYAKSFAHEGQGWGAARGADSAVARARQRLLSDPSETVLNRPDLKRHKTTHIQKPFYGTQWDAESLMRSLRGTIVKSIGDRGGVLKSVWFKTSASFTTVGHAQVWPVHPLKEKTREEVFLYVLMR
jgi:hypothetical protein